jgi:Bacteriophage tail sheath protein
MPQYLSPGVYVEEVPGTPAIVGVGTSTAGFIGVVDTTATNPGGAAFQMPLKPGSTTDRYTIAPVNEPRLVTNWEQFKIQFGDFHTGNKILAHAVYGFFNNGGTRCWVIRVTNFTTAANVDNALREFAAIDEIAIVAVPGQLSDTIQNKLIDHCANLQDRFAVLDGQQTTTITVAAIKGSTKTSKFAALYFPRLLVYDPVTDASIYLPPSGHIAGIYARVDQERGVHKAPANEDVRGADGLEYLVTKNEQDGLNPDGINVIRNFKGNIRVWGARTLGGDANGEYTYINVRRLMNFLRESIDESTQFVVFEPNNLALWQKIIRTVRAFLTEVWRDGALFGATAEEAFYVKCDESLNPPQVRMLGQVITEIGVAIVRPAEFVIFRISQITLKG